MNRGTIVLHSGDIIGARTLRTISRVDVEEEESPGATRNFPTVGPEQNDGRSSANPAVIESTSKPDDALATGANRAAVEEEPVHYSSSDGANSSWQQSENMQDFNPQINIVAARSSTEGLNRNEQSLLPPEANVATPIAPQENGSATASSGRRGEEDNTRSCMGADNDRPRGEDGLEADGSTELENECEPIPQAPSDEAKASCVHLILAHSHKTVLI